MAYDRWSSPDPTAAPPPTPALPFKEGERVVHASFGQGIVVTCRPAGGDFEITVAFRGDAGVKRLLHSFAKLERRDKAPS